MRETVPRPLAKARIASIIRSAAAVRPVAGSAISQCGRGKAGRQWAVRASALSASSPPTVADIDAEALEAEKGGRRVLHVDVDVRRGDRERRGEVAEASIVEFEHAGIVAVLELEQGAVPPEMVLQVVAAFPVRRERGEPLDAFAAAALHLHHMGDGMRGPEIAGLERDGAAPGWLGGEIVPGFLVREGMAGEYRCIARDVLRPGRDHALDGANHVLRAAEPEIGEMGETESDHIERMGAQNRFPQDNGTIELAFGPGGQR